MAHGIHRLSLVFPLSSMLTEHSLSHLTKGMVFPLYHTFLTSDIGGGKLMFETQITATGFKPRVFQLCAIVTTNRSNNISIPLISQSQDQMSPPLSAKKKTQTYRE
jgi:hypothetical protein